MWKCLGCKHLEYSEFRYYGGLTGCDPETLSCKENHFYLTSFDPEELEPANKVGDECKDFEKGKGTRS